MSAETCYMRLRDKYVEINYLFIWPMNWGRLTALTHKQNRLNLSYLIKIKT